MKYFVVPAILALSLSAAFARGINPQAVVTMSLTSTLDPLISGTDPAKVAGGTGTINLTARESLIPTKTTATRAYYTLPAGALSTVVNGTTYKSNRPSQMVISIPPKGPDTMTLTVRTKTNGVAVTVVATVQLAKGSFTRAVLKHFIPFSPASQSLAAATASPGLGSKLSYSFLGNTTLLGMSGTASVSSAAR